jgi:hypothetical protein
MAVIATTPLHDGQPATEEICMGSPFEASGRSNVDHSVYIKTNYE